MTMFRPLGSFGAALVFATVLPSLAVAQSSPYVYDSGTIWPRPYADVITPDDPSATERVSFVGKGTVEMFDRDAGGGQGRFVKVPAYLYTLAYDDGAKAQVRVRRSDFERSRADELVQHYGHTLGQLPAFLRHGLDKIDMLKSDALFGGNSTLNSLTITVGATSERYEEVGNIEEVLLHEASHAVADDHYGSAWSRAQAADGRSISKYAYENPKREDIAESFLSFVALAQENSRLPEAELAKALAAIPNRIRFFVDLDPDLYPVQAQASRALDPRKVEVGFDGTGRYRLTTEHLGEGYSLDVLNKGARRDVVMSPSGGYSGQQWSITPVGNGSYRLTSGFTGGGLSLDVVNSGDRDVVRLQTTRNTTGQRWKIEPAGDGYYRLTTEWQGEGRSLDVLQVDGRRIPRLADTGDVSGQRWRISRLK